MKSTLRTVICGVAACALVFTVVSSQAATIIKLDLATNEPPSSVSGPDVSMNGAGILSTVNDSNISTPGDHNTRVEITGFLKTVVGGGDIIFPDASFTLSGLARAPGAATVNGPLVTQAFTGGTFSLYNASNFLLLSGTLNSSVLAGAIGSVASGTGALFTTSLGTVTGGNFADDIAHNSISLSISMTNVNGGNGFSVTAGNLDPFMAGASVEIGGDPAPVPEPATFGLLGLVAPAALAFARRRR